jgi:Dephospho-CoA kinase
MPKLILGLVGPAGAGKGTVAERLKKRYGADSRIFSDMMRNVLHCIGLESSRDHLIRLSVALRGAFGQDVFAKAMERQVAESSAEIVIVDGIRRTEDIQHLEKLPQFHLIEVHAPARIRFERIKKRGEKAGETEMSWELFQKTEQRETERTVAAVAQKAEFRIENGGDRSQLEEEITRCMTPLWKSV